MPANTIVITLGDPNGIGPELVCRHFAEALRNDARYILIGPEEPLEYHCRPLGMRPFWQTIDDSIDIAALDSGIYSLTPEGLLEYEFTPGRPTPEGGEAAGVSLELAARMVLGGKADALVTCPLNKAMLQEAGFDFPGHTEFLAKMSGLGPDDICMHLGGPKLRVSLVTTHPPLKDVPRLVTREKILHCLRLTCDFADRLGLSELPVAVCGLNPHAGESGKIGREEIDVIIPGIEDARAEGLNVEGPYPADTVFGKAARGEFAAVLAMYHDQGLGPLKLLHFGEAVNVTLGLPFVRTSPDHGTAYDIVGKYEADLGSFREAMELAARLVR